MVLQGPELPAANDEMPRCVHHWVLGEPKSGHILGRCLRCNLNRVFPASPDSAERFDDYRELTATSSYLSGERLSA